MAPFASGRGCAQHGSAAVADLKTNQGSAHVIQINACHDHIPYVLASEAPRLHSALSESVVSGGTREMRWIDGGHVCGCLHASTVLVSAIIDAVDAL
eukprot:COSAG05_NODE_1146_length_5731_cov_2.187322_3_plen_97_part_00